MRHLAHALLLAALFLSLPLLTTAAPPTPASAPAPVPASAAPQLIVQDADPANRKPLHLAKADIHAVITGTLAETTMTLTFANDTARVLEGELEFPLPENAAITCYALDINNTLVDAVPVEKQRARAIFETETRARIDPGLVEQTKGNSFRTRVYPIPAKGSRTIKVQYVADLALTKDAATYSLPLEWKQPVGEARLTVEVVNAPSPPTIAGLRNLAFAPQGDRLIASKEFKNVEFASNLSVVLPKPPAQIVAVEKRLPVPSLEDVEKKAPAADRPDHYFFISDQPALASDRVSAKPVRSVGILWDASLSRAKADKSREYDLLTKFLASFDNTSVDVIVFRDSVEPARIFPVRKGDAAEIVRYLQGLACDGATNLAAVPMGPLPPPAEGVDRKAMPYDMLLLFTDGLSNLGAEVPEVPKVPLYAVASAPTANHTLLRYLAEASGGAYLNLQRTTPDEATRALATKPFGLISTTFDPAQIAEVYPAGARPLTNGRITVSGRLLAPEATITLNYGVGTTVTSSQKITLKQAAATDTGLVARFWAQQKVADLSVFPDRNADALLAIGRQFNMVTPNTSLLVLDNVDQYVRHRVVPPKTRPELYQQFIARIEQEGVAKQKDEQAKIDRVLAMWNARVQWWEKEYKYPKDFAFKNPPASTSPTTPLPAMAPAVPPAVDHAMSNTSSARPAGPTGSAPPAMGLSGSATVRPSPAAPGIQMPRGSVMETAPRPAGETTQPPSFNLQSVTASGTTSGGHGGSGDPRKDTAARDAAPTAVITIKPWDPNTPYLTALKDAGPEKAYATYLAQRDQYAGSPAFYLDCADYFLRNNQRALGVRILTNIAELQLESAPLLRVAAYRLLQANEFALAIDLFEKVARLRPDEPQSHRDLALAISQDALGRIWTESEPDFAKHQRRMADLMRAMELYKKVVMNHWDRFDEIEVVALMEANALWDKIIHTDSYRWMQRTQPITNPLDPRLVKNLDCDVRVVLTWDADNTDIDLWVTEPSGEVAMYNHNRTTIGGLVSHDFTQGYGPEEYCLRHAMPGKYKVQANYFGSQQQTLSGPVTVQATVITNFGRPNEKRAPLTLRLGQAKETVTVGEITIDPTK